MRIIPAIDIINGKCVRLTKGDYSTVKIYNEDPIEVAKQFENAGIKFLHVVDLDGAKSGKIVNHKVLYELTTQTNLHIDFGGGIKDSENLQLAFDNGAKQVTIGSIAVINPPLFMQWLYEYGADKIILGADCKNRKVSTMGWLENSVFDVVDFIKEYELKGVKNVICTDVAKDGMLQGSADQLYEEILEQTNINLIASGGVSSTSDLKNLKSIGCEGVIIGKAIYEGKISLKNLIALC